MFMSAGTVGRRRVHLRRGVVALATAALLGPLVASGPAGAQTALSLLTTASPDTSVGLGIFANANLLNVSSPPTGTITFTLFGPDDTSCATPIFTSTVPVSGTSINSATFTTSRAGTYRWVSRYSGDANYLTAVTGCGEGASTMVVTKARTVLTIQAHDPNRIDRLRAVAFLNGGHNPTGNIDFVVTGPDDIFCLGPPVFTTTANRPVDGNGRYVSRSFRPRQTGTYVWRAIYSGDADNLGTAYTGCLDPEASVVFEGPSLLSVQALGLSLSLDVE